MKNLLKSFLVLLLLTACNQTSSTDNQDDESNDPITEEDANKDPKEEGELLLFEPAMYKSHLSQKIEALEAEIKKLKSIEKPTDEDKTALKKAEAQQEEARTENENTNDCDKYLKNITCSELYESMIMSRAMKARRIPRGCPDETNCFPLDERLKYILVSKLVKEFNIYFYNSQGQEVGKIESKPLTLDGFENFNAFPVSFEKIDDKVTIKVERTSLSNEPVTYEIEAENL